MKVLTPDYLSPEESVDEHGDFQQFIVRRQPWQNERFKALKDTLEEMEQDHAQPTTSEAVEGRHVSIVPSKIIPSSLRGKTTKFKYIFG